MTTSETEQCFSTLKLIKLCKNTLSEGRLNALLSIEGIQDTTELFARYQTLQNYPKK